MKQTKISVLADWDDEAQVWVATSDDIAGLAIEAATLESLSMKLAGALQDLIEMNDENRGDGQSHTVEIVARKSLILPAVA